MAASLPGALTPCLPASRSSASPNAQTLIVQKRRAAAGALPSGPNRLGSSCTTGSGTRSLTSGV
eukprot:9163908-Lingulodinium_polyedra.AAC.1